MNKKNILIGVSIIGTSVISYKIGKTVAYIESIKTGLNFAEELFPGFKKSAAKRFSDNVIESIFDKKKKDTR